MKIRTSFVTNSSSSSFLVISNNGTYFPKNSYKDKNYIIEGSYEFGWENIKYTSIDERVAFAYLQAMYIKRDDWINMLNKVIKEYTGCNKVINKLTVDVYHSSNYSYIDHQSCSTEGENIEMFDSEDTLADFLFNNGSYIQGGNDNGW